MSVYTDAVLADSPSYYWRFSEDNPAHGTNAADSSGNNRPAIYYHLVAGNMTSPPGLIAADIDRAYAHVPSVGVVYSLEKPFAIVNAQITLEMWLYRSTVGGVLAMPYTHLSVPVSGQNGMYIFWGGQFGFTARSIVLAVQGNAAGTVTWVDAVPVGPNGDGTGIPVHQVITFDDVNHTAELFINGVSKGSQTVPAAAATATLTYVGYWAANNTYGLYPWPGLIDEVAVYPAILTPAQIETHHDAGVAVSRWGRVWI